MTKYALQSQVLKFWNKDSDWCRVSVITSASRLEIIRKDRCDVEYFHGIWIQNIWNQKCYLINRTNDSFCFDPCMNEQFDLRCISNPNRNMAITQPSVLSYRIHHSSNTQLYIIRVLETGITWIIFIGKDKWSFPAQNACYLQLCENLLHILYVRYIIIWTLNNCDSILHDLDKLYEILLPYMCIHIFLSLFGFDY